MKKIYISCHPKERNIIKVKEMIDFLKKNEVDIKFHDRSSQEENQDNRLDFIENCDVFITVLSNNYKSNSRLLFELDYAKSLRRVRTHIGENQKPKIFGLKTSSFNQLNCFVDLTDIIWADNSLGKENLLSLL